MSSARLRPLPLAPEIPGLWFRTYRDESDLPAIVELLRAADTADGERHFNSLGSVHPDWRRRLASSSEWHKPLETS